MIAAALAAWKLAKAIPWQVWLAVAVITCAGLYHWHAVDAAYDRGAADYKARIEAGNKASGEEADKGEAAVRACLAPSHWNRETGRCEQ